jgi:hypothetical protein
MPQLRGNEPILGLNKSKARRFVDGLYAVGDNISKISTNHMIKLYVALLITFLCYELSYM